MLEFLGHSCLGKRYVVYLHKYSLESGAIFRHVCSTMFVVCVYNIGFGCPLVAPYYKVVFVAGTVAYILGDDDI